MILELNGYEAEVIRDVLNESLFRTSCGLENFDLDSNPDTAARVAVMYVITTKIAEGLRND